MFPHPEDCTQFLICAENHVGTFVAETVPCPEHYGFSASERTCVPSKQCRPSRPPAGSRGTRAAEQGACKASGPYCEGCDRLVVCANFGERGLTALTNISCSDIDPDMSCSKATCTTQPAPSTQPCAGADKAGTFHCLQPGFFPDPADCKQFHVCGSDLSHYKGQCDEHFDAELGICTSVDPDDKTSQPVSNTPSGSEPQPNTPSEQQCKILETPCTAAKSTPVKLPSNPSYYVICIPVATKNRKEPYVYQISVAKCPARQVFNDETLSCELSCSGKRGRFQDPDSCRSYIECSANVATKKPCLENFAFDPNRKSCLPESLVPGCQRTRAIEESTTTLQADTTTQATLTSTSTTTQTTPSEGFRCRATGAFPDESDCRGFITCSLVSRSDGVYFRMRRRRCPFFTYFNRNGFCQLGFCWN